MSKCKLGVSKIDYLGHMINAYGVMADPKKITTILEWPLPTDIKSLRGFLGLMGYYHKFIKYYGTIATSLTDLLIQDNFY